MSVPLGVTSARRNSVSRCRRKIYFIRVCFYKKMLLRKKAANFVLFSKQWIHWKLLNFIWEGKFIAMSKNIKRTKKKLLHNKEYTFLEISFDAFLPLSVGNASWAKNYQIQSWIFIFSDSLLTLYCEITERAPRLKT